MAASRSDAKILRTVGELGAVGLAFVLALAIGFWVGHLLDGWLGTSPWFSIIFFFFGLAAGVLNVYRAVTGTGGAVGYHPPAESGRSPNQWDDEDC